MQFNDSEISLQKCMLQVTVPFHVDAIYTSRKSALDGYFKVKQGDSYST